MVGEWTYRDRPPIVMRPCHFRDGWQVSPRRGSTYRVDIANGPPDIETFDRRRVDPPAGCRAAAEPATCLDGGPSTKHQAPSTVITFGWWPFRRSRVDP